MRGDYEKRREGERKERKRKEEKNKVLEGEEKKRYEGGKHSIQMRIRGNENKVEKK